MVEIHYILYGMKDEDCNYMGIPENQRKELELLINGCNDIFNDIEVNICSLYKIKDEMSEDKRIREGIVYNIPFGCSGKALLPTDLKPEHKDEKIPFYHLHYLNLFKKRKNDLSQNSRNGILKKKGKDAKIMYK